MTENCIYCGSVVRKRQEAVTCDACDSDNIGGVIPLSCETTFIIGTNEEDFKSLPTQGVETRSRNNVAGARIFNQTGKCKKLTDEYTTVEPGYEYIEKVYFKIEFQPWISTDLMNPSDPSDDELNLLNLPLTMWSRLDFSFVRKPPSEYFFWLTNDNRRIDDNPIAVGVKERKSQLIFGHPSKNDFEILPFEWQAMCPLVECKISLVIKDTQIKVLVNDKEVKNAKYGVERTLVRQRRKVIIVARANTAVAGFTSFEFRK
ncbi:uncharacterized protein LOC132754680 [Ruditapes philippinarum]|uniref:uncharacterized protein LOC132754680 n=1 Tax=Ruditapes philippinarum TaxID=129788 RepID=UPI00295BFEFF|nr:uncharacterized protein LOC132754680 [Ruditapes philippinarum]